MTTVRTPAEPNPELDDLISSQPLPMTLAPATSTAEKKEMKTVSTTVPTAVKSFFLLTDTAFQTALTKLSNDTNPNNEYKLYQWGYLYLRAGEIDEAKDLVTMAQSLTVCERDFNHFQKSTLDLINDVRRHLDEEKKRIPAQRPSSEQAVLFRQYAENLIAV